MLLEGGNRKTFNDPDIASVSVIIVTYNAATTLQECLDSIYRQTYSHIEIIIIDGGSNDGTIEILDKNSAYINYWRSEKDNGIYDAMNKALNYITGNWVYFLGADDVLFDDFSAFAQELKNPDTIYYARVSSLGTPTFPVSPYVFAKIGICHQAIIYPKAVFETARFDTKYRISADYAFNIPLFQGSKFRFEFKDHLIARFNHTGVSSTNIDQPFEKDRSSIVLKNFGFKIWLRYQFWKLKKNLKQKKAQ